MTRQERIIAMAKEIEIARAKAKLEKAIHSTKGESRARRGMFKASMAHLNALLGE